MPDPDKPLFWMGNALRTPPMSRRARVQAGVLLRLLRRCRQRLDDWRSHRP